MKKMNLVAVIGVAVVALGLLAAVIFKTTTASSANDMSGLLPKTRSDLPKGRANPYAAKLKAEGGKGGRMPAPSQP